MDYPLLFQRGHRNFYKSIILFIPRRMNRAVCADWSISNPRPMKIRPIRVLAGPRKCSNCIDLSSLVSGRV